MNAIKLVKQVLQLYIVTIVGNANRQCLTIEACQPNKSRLGLHNQLLSH